MGNNSGQINVKFTPEQKEIIRSLIGPMGGTEAEVLRTIVVTWLSEKSFINELINRKLQEKKKG